MKKQKGKKTGTKKKDDKAETEVEAPSTATEKAEDAKDDLRAAPKDGDDSVEVSPEVAVDDAQPAEAHRPSHDRKPSLSLQSRMRSDSFRRGSTAQQPLSPSLKSPTLPPLSPGGDSIQDIYRKQAQRIEELERENKRLQQESQEAGLRWRKTEAELEELRETSAEVAELRSKADQADSRAAEVEKLVCSPAVTTHAPFTT